MLSVYKRKRTNSAYGRPLIISKRYRRASARVPRPRFRPGIDRTGGYYGRFGPSGEMKFFDSICDVVTVLIAGTIAKVSINNIAQGITESTRIGRKCTIRSINWHWESHLPTFVGGNPPPPGDIIRIILYLDKQCNGASAAVLDILELATIRSFRNLANSQRFQILMDKQVTINYQSISSTSAILYNTGEVIRSGSFYKKCEIPLEFSGVEGDTTELRSNNVGILIIGENGLQEFRSHLRIRFSDNGPVH